MQAEPIATPAPSATEIYYRALARLRSLPTGPYVEYRMRQVNIRSDGILANAMDQSVRERRRDRASWNLMLAADDSHPSWNGEVWIGQHYIIPDAFLPVSVIRRQSRAPTPFASNEPRGATGNLPGLDTAGAFPEISTTMASPNYVVTLIGWTQLDSCGQVAHLGLKPIRDPERYNVSELWVRTSDYMLCKAAYNSHLYRDQSERWPPGSAFVTATLDNRGLVTRFDTQNVITMANVSTTTHGEFLDVVWADAEPDYYFDQKLWDAHLPVR